MYVSNGSPSVPPPCGLYGVKGLGLFESGLDFTQWGWPEGLAVGIGLYVLISVTSTTKRAGRAVSRKVRAAARA